jgi:antitoxin MazE
MKVERWGNNIVIPISPQELAERGLSVGDEVDLTLADASTLASEKKARKEAMFARMRELARPLPPDYKFNRSESNGFEEE